MCVDVEAERVRINPWSLGASISYDLADIRAKIVSQDPADQEQARQACHQIIDDQSLSIAIRGAAAELLREIPAR
jgi:hypothetical protein